MRKIIGILTLILLVSLMGFSQQRSGNIYGTIIAENKAPVEGILVTVSGDLIGKMTTLTNMNGNFRFISLSPGIYEIKAELEGFATIVKKDIRIEVGRNVTLNFTIVPERLQEEVVVTAAPVAIDTMKTTHATNLNKEELQSLPSARDPFVILELTPGLAMDRANIGGSESGQQSNFVSSGSGRGSSTWSTDGINVTDQIATGAAPQYYDFDAFEEIQIQTGAADITSLTAGAQINMITKRGGNKFTGGGRFYFTSDGLQGENVPADYPEDINPAQIKRIIDTGLNIGGPIIKDKLWFWAGGALQDIQKYSVAKDEAGDPIVQTQELKNFEAKVNFNLGKHRIEGFYNWSSKDVEGRVSNSHLDAWEAHYRQTSPHPFMKIQDEFTVSDNLFISAKFGYFEGGFLLTPIGPVGGITYYDRDKGRYWGTYRESDYIRHQHFYQAIGHLFVDKFLGTSHELQLGAEYKFFPGKRTRTYYSQRLYYRSYNSPTDNDPYRAYIYRNSDYSYNLDRLSFFVQDSISFKRLTVLLGLRYDIQSGGVNELSVPGTNVDWAGEYNMDAVQVQAMDLNFKWKNFSPRIGLIYDITGEGKTLLKVNYGLYGEHFDPDFCYDLASTYGYVRFSWDDKNGDELASADEVNYYRTYDYFNQVDPSEMYDPNLSSPKTIDSSLGIEHELYKDFAVGVNFIYRKMYNTLQQLDYLELKDGTERLPTPDDWEIGGHMPSEWGGYAWWQYKPYVDDETTKPWNINNKHYYRRYLGIELTFRKRLSAASRWMVNGSFTWQKWTRHYPNRNAYFNNYNPTNHEPVELMDGQPASYTSGSSGATESVINPRWMAKLGFMVQLPLKINFGGTLLVRDGYILPIYYEDDNIETAVTGNIPSTYTAAFGTHRLPSHNIVNLRLERGINIDFIRATFSLDVFNLFNSSTTLDQNYNAGSTIYGDPVMITSPRIFRFGVRLNF